MKTFLTTLFLIALISPTIAQKMDTVVHQKDGVMDSFYISLIPEKTTKGLIVILGGFSSPQETLKETNLPFKACAAGYTVVLPYLYLHRSVKITGQSTCGIYFLPWKGLSAEW